MGRNLSILLTQGVFSPHFREIEQMDLPESRVILILVELFSPKCLSYLGQTCLSYFVTKNLNNFGQNDWVFSYKECFYRQLFKISTKSCMIADYAQDIWVNILKICRKFELFPGIAWVIFKTLSYFEISEKKACYKYTVFNKELQVVY